MSEKRKRLLSLYASFAFCLIVFSLTLEMAHESPLGVDDVWIVWFLSIMAGAFVGGSVMRLFQWIESGEKELK